MRGTKRRSMPSQRRCVVALAGLVTCGALSACGFSGFGATSDSDTLNLLLIDQPVTEDMRDTWIPKFEEKTGIEVNVELVPESGLESKLSLALSTGAARYDVVSTSVQNWSTFVAAGWIDPLDKYLEGRNTPESFRAGYSDQILDSLRVNGHLYSMPYQIAVDLLMYNKQMFRDAGLDPNDPPSTMAEVVEAAKQLTTSDHAGFVARGTRAGDENTYSWLMMWLLNGGSWNAEGSSSYDVLDSPEAIKATEQYQTLMTDYAPEGVNSYGFADALLAMQQGQAAMWLDGSVLASALEDPESSTIAGDVGYTALTGPGKDYLVAGVWGLSIPSDAANKDEAWELIKFLDGPQVAKSQVLEGINGSPPRLDILERPDVQSEVNPDFLDALNEGLKHATPLYTPVIPEGDQIRSILSLELSSVLSGDKSAEDAMQDANESIREVTADDH